MADILTRRYPDGLPPYLAAAVSAEDQKTADERLPHGSCIAPTAPPTTQVAPRCGGDLEYHRESITRKAFHDPATRGLLGF